MFNMENAMETLEKQQIQYLNSYQGQLYCTITLNGQMRKEAIISNQ